MGKYDALTRALRGHGPNVTLTFEEISRLLPGGLPPSAYRHREWWSNEQGGSHVQAGGWIGAGYCVASVTLAGRSVVFERVSA
jgi:hypothetical protein